MGLFSLAIAAGSAIFKSRSKRKAAEAKAKAEQKRVAAEQLARDKEREHQLAMSRQETQKKDAMMKYLPIGLGGLGLILIGLLLIKKK